MLKASAVCSAIQYEIIRQSCDQGLMDNKVQDVRCRGSITKTARMAYCFQVGSYHIDSYFM